MTTTRTPLRILGIDPGLKVTGYAVLEVAPRGPKLCEAGVIRGRTRDSLAARVATRSSRAWLT